MALLDKLLKLSGARQQDEPIYYEPLRRGDFVAAIPMLRQAMRQEDAHAMAIFGTLLAFGRGIEQDQADAADWFRQSAVRGELAGQSAYGACLASGLGVAMNRDEAAYWLYRAGRAGYSPAVDILADLVLSDASVVGKHFSEAEFQDVLRIARRPKDSALH